MGVRRHKADIFPTKQSVYVIFNTYYVLIVLCLFYMF